MYFPNYSSYKGQRPFKNESKFYKNIDITRNTSHRTVQRLLFEQLDQKFSIYLFTSIHNFYKTRKGTSQCLFGRKFDT